MPDGVVQWVDPTTGRAAVVRGGHVYAASDRDIEPVARHAGARVHFDIHRQDGGERAVDVRLRVGTRVSHQQGRYGTLTGARRPDTKGPAPFAHPHPERGRMLAAHPLEVVRAWVDSLQDQDRDTALSLYASDAVVHADAQDLAGRSEIGGYLEASPMFGLNRDPYIAGEDETVVARWVGDRRARVEVRARIENGLIIEQWVGVPAPEGRTVQSQAGASPIEIAVLTRGRVEDGDVDYAVARLETILRRIDDPILFARLKLGVAGDPARARPALAQVTIDVNGELIRAHVASHTNTEAADLLQRRLADKLDQRAQRRDYLHSRGAAGRPGEWRHGDLPTERPDYYERPPEDRQLVRHKTLAIDELTVDEAAFDMVQLDYDFYLFRDLASGEDAVLERTDDGGYRLTRLHTTSVETGTAAIELTAAGTPPAELTVPDAIQRLDSGGEPFVFFANTFTGRGCVVYRRYDGHYGLITPA